MIWMVSAVTFTLTAVIVMVIWFLYTGESTQEMVRGRIEQLRAAENWAGIAADLKLVRDEMFSTIPALHQIAGASAGCGLGAEMYFPGGHENKAGQDFLAVRRARDRRIRHCRPFSPRLYCGRRGNHCSR